MVYALDINSTTYLPSKFDSIATLFNVIVPLLFIGGAFVFLGILLLAAYHWITGGDNPESIKKAQATFAFAIIGLFIAFFSYLVVKLLGIFFNIGGAMPF